MAGGEIQRADGEMAYRIQKDQGRRDQRKLAEAAEAGGDATLAEAEGEAVEDATSAGEEEGTGRTVLDSAGTKQW